MRQLLLFLFVSYSAFARQGWVINNSSAAVPARPNTAAYNAITQYRMEFRLRNCTAGGGIAGGDMPLLILTDCSKIIFNSPPDPATQTGAGFPSGSPSVDVRVQRINGGAQLCVEVFRTDTGAYNYNCVTGNPGGAADFHAGNFWLGAGYHAGTQATLDYFRWFSTTVPVGTPPNPNATGDLGDWEFEGNGNDSSGNGLNLNGGNNGYTTTPTFSPVISFPARSNCFTNNSAPNPWFCVYSPSPAIPLSTTAFSPNQGDTTTYTWSQLDGPSNGTIGNANSANASVSGLNNFGQYDFKVTVTDSENNQTSGTLTLGVVTVGGTNNCQVTSIPANLKPLIGPVTPWGSGSPCSPWPWYDIAEVTDANILIATYSTPTAGRTANPGTLTINTNAHDPTVVGTGTHFTTDCAAMSYAPHAPSCDGATGWIWWNAEGGTGNGRYQVQFSVQDDTHATIVNWYQYGAPGPYTGLQYSITNPSELQIPWGNVSQPTYSWNYYDNVIAFYRLYYRTGITAYLTHARALADDWWVYSLDHGYVVGAPRGLGLPGMMTRALDGHPERWPGIENATGSGPQGTPTPGTVDFREAGYLESYLAKLIQVDPNMTGSTKSSYCGNLASSINTFWNSVLSFGYKSAFYAVNQSYPVYGFVVEPWQLVIPATGFRDAYIAASRVCGDTTTANNAIADLVRTVNYTYQYGAIGSRTIPPANGGGQGRPSLAYEIGSPTTGLNAHEPCDGSEGSAATPCTNGTVSISQGGTTVTGVGTNFTSMFACNGTDYIAIVKEVQAAGTGGVHRVLSCASDTQLTVASADAGLASVSGSDYQESPPDASTNCGPSLSQYCNGANNPDQSTDAAGIFGWVYAFGGNLLYRVWGDDMFSAAYGGPAGGPGSIGSPAGPMSAATTNNNYTNGQSLTGNYGYISALPTCSVASTPCGGVNSNPPSTPVHWGKDFGIGSGWSGAMDNYLAYRQMIVGRDPLP